MLETVRVPPELEPLFATAQEFVGAYFRTLHADPAHGTIEVGGQRYILVRAAAMSVEFYATITQLYSDQGEAEARAVARGLLYDLAHAIGAADARAFHHSLDLRDPLAKLSAGPVHFAHTGWAHVSILPESQPTADDQFLLVYDHPYSFEAHAWHNSGQATDFPVCAMNAGYSAGWCTESFGIALVAVEICCKAMGDDTCRFVMAPPARIEHAIATYLHGTPALARAATRYEIPGFFSRKQAEDELREREVQYRSVFESVTDAILIVGLDGQVVAANPAAGRLYERSHADMVGLNLQEVTAPPSHSLVTQQSIAGYGNGDIRGEAVGMAASGRVFEVEFHATAFSYQRQPHILVLVSDISERKRAEAERLQLQEQLLRQNERLRAELSLARTVQQSLLPQRVPWNPQHLAVGSRSLPASVVSSDFYGYFALADGRMLIALGDVAGSGVAAALTMALTISAIESQARLSPQPGACIGALQARLQEQLQSCDMFVSLLVVLVDLQNQQLWLANAGMPAPLLLRAGRVEELWSYGVPLGVGAGGAPAELHAELRPGDRVLLVSDGVIEARNAYGELFGYERLLASLSARPPNETPEQLLENLFAQLATFASTAEQHDDLTVLALQPGAAELR
ncbi:MAG: SpoIIE family protein phosphatase [Roseiflexaceae bacterium]|nr:SpoIIE family protein phosphatase [Roseiflexaceae bacterium]